MLGLGGMYLIKEPQGVIVLIFVKFMQNTVYVGNVNVGEEHNKTVPSVLRP